MLSPELFFHQLEQPLAVPILPPFFLTSTTKPRKSDQIHGSSSKATTLATKRHKSNLLLRFHWSPADLRARSLRAKTKLAQFVSCHVGTSSSNSSDLPVSKSEENVVEVLNNSWAIGDTPTAVGFTPVMTSSFTLPRWMGSSKKKRPKSMHDLASIQERALPPLPPKPPKFDDFPLPPDPNIQLGGDRGESPAFQDLPLRPMTNCSQLDIRHEDILEARLRLRKTQSFGYGLQSQPTPSDSDSNGHRGGLSPPETISQDEVFLDSPDSTLWRAQETTFLPPRVSRLQPSRSLSAQSSQSVSCSWVFGTGNHYGTPKPPSESTSSLIHQLSGGGSQSTAEHNHQHQSGGGHQTHASPSTTTTSGSQGAVNFPGAHPSSEGKRRRNRSNVEAMTAKHFEAEDDQDEDPSSMMTSGSDHQTRLGNGKEDNDRQVNGPDTPSGSSGGSSSKSGSGPHGADSGHPDSPEVLPPDDPPPTEESLGPLPPNWEKAYTDKGEAYFIDHNTGTSHWLDPRLSRVQKKRPEECDENELPFGWERIDDPHYGTYFIDHVNRRTQYENPVLVAKSMNQSGDGLVAPSYGSGAIRQGPAPPPAPPMAPSNGPAGTFPRVKKSHCLNWCLSCVSQKFNRQRRANQNRLSKLKALANLALTSNSNKAIIGGGAPPPPPKETGQPSKDHLDLPQPCSSNLKAFTLTTTRRVYRHQRRLRRRHSSTLSIASIGTDSFQESPVLSRKLSYPLLSSHDSSKKRPCYRHRSYDDLLKITGPSVSIASAGIQSTEFHHHPHHKTVKFILPYSNGASVPTSNSVSSSSSLGTTSALVPFSYPNTATLVPDPYYSYSTAAAAAATTSFYYPCSTPLCCNPAYYLHYQQHRYFAAVAAAASQQQQQLEFSMTTASSTSPAPFFTRDPNQLRGERIRCQLVKSARGLGFTIVGGDDNVDEFLQIKSVVPNGPAWADGGLKTGDVLVFVNDTCVLGFTHHDMVTMFQSIATGDIVNLEVCRGYPLPFDPDDPNTEIVTTVAVTSPEQNEWASELERQRQHFQGQQQPDAQSMPDLSHHHNPYPGGTNHLRPGSADLLGQNDYGENSSDFSSEVKNTLSAPQADGMTIPITKGGMGFGFTIADSAFGQKVKKILDRPRCKNLQEGDVLVEINSINVRNKSHSEVVQVLKDCPRGQEANISIQRGLLSPNTNGAPGGLATASSSSNQSSPVKNKYKRDKFTADFSGLKPKSGLLFRSKTPTAEIYATQEKEKVPLRPKTPIVDTRNFNRSKTPTSMFSNPFQRNDSTRASLGVGGGGIPTSQYDPYGGITNQMGGLNLHDYNRSQSPGRELDGNYYNQGGANYPQPGLDYPGGYQPDPLYNTTAAMYPEYNNINYSQQQMPSPGKMYGDTYQNYNGNNAHPNYDPTYGYTRGVGGGGGPQGDIQAYRAGSLPRNGGAGSVTGRKESTSFEHSEPLPGGLTRWPRPERRPVPSECIELTVTLHRQDSGFGFRIVGGTEEGSQVSIGHIVPGGAADVDGRLYSGDEIIAVDGNAVLNTSHHQVVELMGEAAHQGRVTLTVRRRLFQHDSYGRIPENYPYDVTVTRRENEGFGFVIISSVSRAGSTIGRIIPGSPAERCGRLHVGDRILAVNHVDINCLHHGEIVNLIKDSGYSVVMTVGPPIDDTSSNASTSHRSSTSSMVTAQAMPTVLPPSDSAGSSIHSNNVDPRSVSVGAPQHSSTNYQSHHHNPQQQSYLTNNNNSSHSHHHNSTSSTSNPHPHHHPFNSQVPPHSSYHLSSSTTNTGFHPSPHSNSNGSYSGMGGPVPPPHTLENYQQEDQELNMLELDDQYYAVELQRGARGFGFSIRGGREFHSMPLFVLRIAVDGPAAADGRLRVGDQIIEINGINTKNMTHGEAIELIKSGGAMVRLLVRRGKMPPSALMEQVGLSPLSPTPTVSMSAMGRPMSAMSQPSHTMMANPNSAYHANLISSHSNYSNNNNNFANGYLPQHPTPPTGNGMVPTPFTAATAMMSNGHLNGPMGHSSPRMAFPPPGTSGAPTSTSSSNDQYNWYNQQNNLYHH